MSFVPLLSSKWWPHYDEDENFPFVHPERLPNLHPMDTCWPTDAQVQHHKALHRAHHLPHNYKYRPWWNKLHRENIANNNSINEKDEFRVILDVPQFMPEEVTVKVVGKHLVVEANHDEKEDEHGWVTRSFVRRYPIPEECDIEKVEPKISSDGILIISIPHKKKPELEKERVVGIKKVFGPAILHPTDLIG